MSSCVRDDEFLVFLCFVFVYSAVKWVFQVFWGVGGFVSEVF